MRIIYRISFCHKEIFPSWFKNFEPILKPSLFSAKICVRNLVHDLDVPFSCFKIDKL